ncbi:MAG TPA: tetratricopeptide repeat protein [Steroidobacteraceae bacterium]|nr:tetratricopeptide repeat protein [Steroidobacteraceae bacterium]
MTAQAGRVGRWLGELRRRKVFRVAAAYVVVAWLLLQLADVTFEPLGLPAWTQTFVIVLAAVGFPFACIFAWIYDVTPQGVERTPRSAGTDAEEAPGAAPPEPSSVTATPNSVAILSFADMSPERDQEYFCDGVAEEIINALCCIEDLRVASRTSAFQFKGRAADSRDIGRILGVRHLLEGSVRKSGNRIRVTAQLIDAATGYHAWSETFERELADVFAIQTEIAQSIVRAMRVKISPTEASRLELGGTRDPQAYDCYLRAKHLQWQTSDTTWPAARALYRRAVELDPQFALAWAGLATCIAVEHAWQLGGGQPALVGEALAASERALALAPDLPEALVAKGHLLMIDGRYDESAAEFARATQLNPGLFDAWYHYGRLWVTRGDPVRAAPFFERAMQIDPEDFQSPTLRMMVGRQIDPPEEIDRLAREVLRRTDAYLANNPEDPRAHYFRAGALLHLGRRAEAFEAADRAIALRPHEFASLYNVACVFAHAGEHDRALDLLDEAVAEGRGNREWLLSDPDWSELRDHPRFRSILGRLEPQSGKGG